MAVNLLYAAGPVAYCAQWPERWRPASFFDLFGASHQLMHICVSAAAVLHGANIESARAIGLNVSCP
eukprot:5887053-Prymnesium_polylepis.1